MSVHRVMGIETEYGLIDPGNPRANPVQMSTRIVRSYAAGVPHAPWDYAGEDPLSDARGYRVPRALAHPTQLTDAPMPTGRSALRSEPANAVLTNGARLYVDHAHPEYSSPEVTNPRDAVRWDRAGDEIMIEAMRAVGSPEIVIFKNNVDGKGAAYGTHENYLVARGVPFHELAYRLTPFFVTRPLMCGAGRVGLGQRSEEAGFQISQRADYVENDIGLETTFNRPIVNTRDEPHADAARWRRLHVIGGDANRFDVATYLKFATTALVLWLVEEDHLPLELDALALSAPVVDSWGVSHEPFEHVLSTAGRARTALDVQRTFLDVIARYAPADPETAFALELWDAVLTGLATDPDSVAHQVEWVAKKQFLEALRRRENLTWDHPRLAAFDLQWADLRPEYSVVTRLEAAGRVQRLVDQQSVHAAVTTPPEDTRAWFRGTMVARYGQAVAAAGWSSVVVDSPSRRALVRIPLSDPQRATRDRAESVVESKDVDELLSHLSGR